MKQISGGKGKKVYPAFKKSNIVTDKVIKWHFSDSASLNIN